MCPNMFSLWSEENVTPSKPCWDTLSVCYIQEEEALSHDRWWQPNGTQNGHIYHPSVVVNPALWHLAPRLLTSSLRKRDG